MSARKTKPIATSGATVIMVEYRDESGPAMVLGIFSASAKAHDAIEEDAIDHGERWYRTEPMALDEVDPT